MLPTHPKPRRGFLLRRSGSRAPAFLNPRGLAKRFGVSAEIIRKWRKLPWKATEEERAIIRTLRR